MGISVYTRNEELSFFNICENDWLVKGEIKQHSLGFITCTSKIYDNHNKRGMEARKIITQYMK